MHLFLIGYYIERKQETSVEAGGVTRDESGGSNPRNTNKLDWKIFSDNNYVSFKECR